MVGIAIHNDPHENDKPLGISFRQREAIWRVFEVIQSNARFNALDTLTVVLHSVRMPVGFGLQGNVVKLMGRPLSVMAHLKKCVVQVKTKTNCLAHTLLIAIAKLTIYPNSKVYSGAENIPQCPSATCDERYQP